jgi:hypothetical protein
MLSHSDQAWLHGGAVRLLMPCIANGLGELDHHGEQCCDVMNNERELSYARV